MKILNLTQHPATPEQVEAGVFDSSQREELAKLLTFEELPTHSEISERAFEIAVFARREYNQNPFDAVMIGGAPFLMAHLEWELKPDQDGFDGFAPRILYAFSKRESIEQVQPDGSIRKVNVFRHTGFVEIIP